MSSQRSFFLEISKKNFLLKKIYLYYNIYIRNFKFHFKSSQFNEEDIILKMFHKGFIGIYMDIGCFHPVRHNNTFKMYKKGWSGTNIDLNILTIDLFNVARPNDLNLCCAVSNKIEKKKIYYSGDLSPLNTINFKHINILNKLFGTKIKDLKVKKTKTVKLQNIIDKNKIFNINFLNLDIEGQEFDVLKNINFKKVSIDAISVEMFNYDQKSKIRNKKIINFLKKKKFDLKKIIGVNYIFKKIN